MVTHTCIQLPLIQYTLLLQLWDSRHADFRNPTAVRRGWRAVRDSLTWQFDDAELKFVCLSTPDRIRSRFKNIKDCYLR